MVARGNGQNPVPLHAYIGMTAAIGKTSHPALEIHLHAYALCLCAVLHIYIRGGAGDSVYIHAYMYIQLSIIYIIYDCVA